MGRALAANKYLSDDPLAVADPVRPDDLSGSLFLPDLAVGRLVETPGEITTAIATFISQDGVLDLSVLDPVNGHKVLVTGYDFLTDSAAKVRERWKAAFGAATPVGSPAPVDGSLVGGNWGLARWRRESAALRTHLAGNGGARYGVMSLSGHATHSRKACPGTEPFDIQGWPRRTSTASDACATPSLGARWTSPAGSSTRWAATAGCRCPGSCATDANHSLDLPQTLLSRGVVSLRREHRLRLGAQVRHRLRRAPGGAPDRGADRGRHRGDRATRCGGPSSATSWRRRATTPTTRRA